jgi:hypothetical protein
VTLRLWLRDDDAGPWTAPLAAWLDRLSGLGLPAALAVVPVWLEDRTAEAIAARPGLRVLQHGIAHADHAAPGAKKIELGGTADRDALREGLRHGTERLRLAFADRFLPVLVPPWNRIDPDVEAMLPEFGYAAVSTFHTRQAPAVPGLARIDTHIDVVDWRLRRLRPVAALDAELERLAATLAEGPIGILGHHALLDDDARAAFGDWLGSLARRHRVEWLAPDDLFRRPG